MGYQSAALAYNFGLNYEFGKRVIKSMSNEKFNKIAEDPIMLNELTSRHHDVLLQAFIHEVPKVDKIQDLIIKKMVELEFAKIKVMPELIAQIPKGFIEGLFALGGSETSGPVQVPQPGPAPPPGKGKQTPGTPKILPPKLSNSEVIANSFGHIACGTARGRANCTIWVYRTKGDNRSGYKVKSGLSNKSQAISYARQFWPAESYDYKSIGNITYFYLK